MNTTTKIVKLAVVIGILGTTAAMANPRAWDIHEDILDRRENIIDESYTHGPLDKLEDILDRIEDVHDAANVKHGRRYVHVVPMRRLVKLPPRPVRVKVCWRR